MRTLLAACSATLLFAALLSGCSSKPKAETLSAAALGAAMLDQAHLPFSKLEGRAAFVDHYDCEGGITLTPGAHQRCHVYPTDPMADEYTVKVTVNDLGQLTSTVVS